VTEQRPLVPAIRSERRVGATVTPSTPYTRFQPQMPPRSRRGARACPREVHEEDDETGKHGRGISKSRRASRILVCGPASRSPTCDGGAHLRRCRCPRRNTPSFLVARRRVCGLDQVELVARDGREVNDVQKHGLVVPHVAKAARVSGGGLPEVPLGKKKRIWIDGNTNG
jgi:hypothetical protein